VKKSCFYKCTTSLRTPQTPQGNASDLVQSHFGSPASKWLESGIAPLVPRGFYPTCWGLNQPTPSEACRALPIECGALFRKRQNVRPFPWIIELEFLPIQNRAFYIMWGFLGSHLLRVVYDWAFLMECGTFLTEYGAVSMQYRALPM